MSARRIWYITAPNWFKNLSYDNKNYKLMIDLILSKGGSDIRVADSMSRFGEKSLIFRATHAEADEIQTVLDTFVPDFE